MKSGRIPAVKICCIQSIEEAWLAINYGADFLGLVSEMPSGPGAIAEELIKNIVATIPPAITTVLLTSKTDADEVIAQHRRCGGRVIQIVDRLQRGRLQDIRQALPGISIMQVIHVRDETAIAEAIAVASKVDAILLDSGHPDLPIKVLGGTGRTHDWEISRAIRSAVKVPIFLAGGLNPANVAQAIRVVQPYGVDVCTGVRSNGLLDEGKLQRFMAEVAAAAGNPEFQL